MKKNQRIILLFGIIILIGLLYLFVREPPNIEIVSTNHRTGLIDQEFVVWIDVSLYNSGGEGNENVCVSVTQKTESWIKSENVYLLPDQTKIVTFFFPEVTAWERLCAYHVWIPIGMPFLT